MEFLGNDGQGRGQAEVGHDADFVGGGGHEVAEEPQHARGLLHGPGHQAGDHGGAYRVEPVLERGDDPEVAAAAAQAPEQLGVLVVAGDKELAVGGDHVAGREVVDGESEAAHEVADPATEGQPADAGVGDDAARHGQPEGLGLVVDVAPQTAALSPDRSRQGVDPHPGHGGQVDHQAVVTHGVSGDGVAAASHRHRQRPLPGELDRGQHVGRPRAAGDDRGPTLDVPVPDLPGGLVTLVARFEYRSEEPLDLHHALRSVRCVQTVRW